MVQGPGAQTEFVVATRFGPRMVEGFADLLTALDVIGEPCRFPFAVRASPAYAPSSPAASASAAPAGPAACASAKIRCASSRFSRGTCTSNSSTGSVLVPTTMAEMPLASITP